MVNVEVDRGLELDPHIYRITSSETCLPNPGAPTEPSKNSGVREVRWMKRRYTAKEYNYAMELLNQGKSLNETSRLTGIPKSTLHDWRAGKHKPPLAWWRPKPCPELAYIIGVQLSDGYIYEKKKEWKYKNGLDAKDREYVEHYSYCVARLLGRKRNRIRLRKDERWHVEYGSAAFCTWFKRQTLRTLKRYIEHCKECTKVFLRGFLDGDGSNNGKQVFVCNSNRELLVYVKQLLEKLGVRTGKILIVTKAGTEHRMRNGEIIKTRKTVFQLCVNKKDFLQRIGFSIARKNK